MLAQPVASLSASRALMQHRAHVDAFHGNMVWTEETHMVDEMSAPAALVRPYGLCGQSSGHGFDWESVSELGEWCICTRRTHQPHDCETPARDGRFRGTGLYPSGSDQPSICTDRTRCEIGVLSPGIWSHECRKWLVGWLSRTLDECTPAGRTAAERRIS